MVFAQRSGEDDSVLQAVSERRSAESGYNVVMKYVMGLLLVCLLFGCRRTGESVVAKQESNVESRPLSSPKSAGGPLFRKRLSDETGVDLVQMFPKDAPPGMISDQSSGSGVCVGDFDADGLPDIYVTNYDQGNRLYRNLGEFRFADVTAEKNVGGEGRWCAGPSFVDIDNDGDLDLHVCVYAQPNLLYVNDGNGGFTEQAEKFGLSVVAASVMASFADYDLDGDLDAYLVTHRLIDERGRHQLPRNPNAAMEDGVIQVKQKRLRVMPEYKDWFSVMSKGEAGRFALVIAGQQDLLLRNERGSFRPVNKEAGISGHRIGLSAVWWDYNNDGRPDLYVSNDYKGADQLYRNNGDGTFTDVVEEVCPHIPWYSMGADVGDINNDGWLDLFASDMSGTSHYKQKVAMGDMSEDAWFLDLAQPQQYMRNAQFVNAGGGRMLEVAKMAGIASTDWTWSPKFGDLDNDGWLDLFVANGMSRDFMNSDVGKGSTRGGSLWANKPVMREKNLAFRNRQDFRFEKVGAEWGLDEMSASYGASYADLDRDGDLDLVATNFDGPLLVYENQSSAGKRLLVKLVGTKSNRDGIGARVTLYTSDGKKQTRFLSSSQGFMSMNEPLLHFGLGTTSATSMRIQWPSGNVQLVEAIADNQFVTVTESEPFVAKNTEETPATLFSSSEHLSPHTHIERTFDDFEKQPLLPARKSRLGPGVACGDLDGDGRADFYLGGAAGAPGEIVLADGEASSDAFANDAASEDMGALLLDADSDGDLDLYVVSGGVEAEVGDPMLQDRLYLQHDSKFQKAEGRLPVFPASGSCVVASDFDRDGDLDLFVGGHVVPGRYPHSSASRLLRNDAGEFSDVTKEVAPQLGDMQLVNGAIWSDANGDGLIDLLVAQEWRTIEIFLSDGEKLTKAAATGLSGYTGWWNGIVAGDVDEDGDMDYVVTNIGLNTKYHASDEHPVRLYCGDFGTGDERLIEAKYENGVLLPERGKSCSTAAIPILSSKFQTYKAFAVAGLEEIYSADRLNQSLNLSATTLESGLLINDGSARFTFQSLPRFAQLAPSQGAVITDFDGDGHVDLVLAQNDFSPQRETGRLDGGVSLLLRGDGNGQFAPMWPHESGISVSGDAQCVAVADLNRDDRPDLVFGVNDEAWRTLVLNKPAKFLKVTLRGKAGNSTGVGAKVEVLLSSGKKLTSEVYAGAGYLSQSSPDLFFGLGDSTVSSIEVRWPDGSVTSSSPGNSGAVVIDHPDRQ